MASDPVHAPIEEDMVHHPKLSLRSLALALLAGALAVSAQAGPNLGDRDGDSIDDVWDNCRDVPNANQRDTDGDGCGNLCDPDYDQNGNVGATDFTLLRSLFGTSKSDPDFNSNADHDGNGTIDSTDFEIYRNHFGGPPGPSKRNDRDPDACP
ncbi:dockerin type I domain-containing protein [Myxococcota bacterium]|nr:dockerin type I domain-containing protein [Myxococcota bacterium]